MATSDSTPKTIEIPLTRGFVAVVDECDGDLAAFNWYASNSVDAYAYAARKIPVGDGRYKVVFMHVVILERMLERSLVKGEICDHIHRNPRDNRRSELRLASTAQNGANQRINATNKTGYKGVTETAEGTFRTSIKVNGQRRYIGTYGTPLEAYAAYCISAREQFGEFAYLPDEDKVQGVIPTRLTHRRPYKKRR